MWLYHRTGGDGVQMTKKPNDQKDDGEPAFSPDGRYLYYSEDITAGRRSSSTTRTPTPRSTPSSASTAQTGEIDALRHRPRRRRPADAVARRQVLAFVRRVRDKSVLFVADLESGASAPVYDGLERDMQETWAIHGVYPGMAWTPDVEVDRVLGRRQAPAASTSASKAVTDIPFHVEATQRITEAVRFPVEVAPDEFDAKMLRWVAGRRPRATGWSTRRSATSGSATCRTARPSG